jgi:hypothetical protein
MSANKGKSASQTAVGGGKHSQAASRSRIAGDTHYGSSDRAGRFLLSVTQHEEAIAHIVRLLGWRVYATNAPQDMLYRSNKQCWRIEKNTWWSAIVGG